MSRKAFARSAVGGTLATALAACGGGGGDSSPPVVLNPPVISAQAGYNRVGNAPLFSGYDYLGRRFFVNVTKTF